MYMQYENDKSRMTIYPWPRIIFLEYRRVIVLGIQLKIFITNMRKDVKFV